MFLCVCLSDCLWHWKSKIKSSSAKGNTPENTSKAETTELDSTFDSSGVNLEHCGHLPVLCSCHKQLYPTYEMALIIVFKTRLCAREFENVT